MNKFLKQFFFTTFSVVLITNVTLAQADTSTPPQENYCPNLTLTLARGDSDLTKNGEVTKLQRFLKVNLDLNDSQFLVTGYFGNITKNYVKQFQKEQSLIVTGIVGRITRERIALVCNPNDDTPPPANNIVYYWFTETFGTCTNNVQYRNVACKSSQNQIVSDSFCANQTRPTNSQSCTTNNTNNNNQSCSLNGNTLPHNSTIQGFLSNTVFSPNTCSPTTFTCNNGTITPSPYYSTCSTLSNNNTNNNQSCNFNGQTIQHNSSVTAYQTGSVFSPNTCTSQTRTCTNGSLSGTYTYSSCNVTQPNNVTYSWNTTDWGTCSNNQQTRTVTCKDNNNNIVADSYCTSTKPNSTQSCSSGGGNVTTASCTYAGVTYQEGYIYKVTNYSDKSGNKLSLKCDNGFWLGYFSSNNIEAPVWVSNICKMYPTSSLTEVFRNAGCLTNTSNLIWLAYKSLHVNIGTSYEVSVGRNCNSSVETYCASSKINWGDGQVTNIPKPNSILPLGTGDTFIHTFTQKGNYIIEVIPEKIGAWADFGTNIANVRVD